MNPENEKGDQGSDAPVTCHRRAEHSAGPRQVDGPVVERWWDCVAWWTDPRLSYARGLHDGYRLGRDDQADEDDAVHRVAAHRVAVTVAQADRRAASDRGELVA